MVIIIYHQYFGQVIRLRYLRRLHTESINNIVNKYIAHNVPHHQLASRPSAGREEEKAKNAKSAN